MYASIYMSVCKIIKCMAIYLRCSQYYLGINTETWYYMSQLAKLLVAVLISSDVWFFYLYLLMFWCNLLSRGSLSSALCVAAEFLYTQNDRLIHTECVLNVQDMVYTLERCAFKQFMHLNAFKLALTFSSCIMRRPVLWS